MASHRRLEGRSPIWRAMTAILGVIALVVAMAVTGSSAYADNGSPTTQSDGGNTVSTDTSTTGASTTTAPSTETTASTTPPSEVPPPTDTTTETTAPAAPTTDSVRFSAVNEKGDLLGGAAFTITGGNGTAFCVSDNSATGAATGCKGAKAVADEDPADGAFLVSGLPSDTYTVAAVTPPPNYELTDETKTFTLDNAASTGQPLRGVAAAFVRDATPITLPAFTFTPAPGNLTGDWNYWMTDSDPTNGSSVIPGQTITYTLNAQRSGNSGTVSNALLTASITLGGGLDKSQVSISSTDSAVGYDATHSPVWEAPALKSSAKNTTFTITVNPDAPVGGTIAVALAGNSYTSGKTTYKGSFSTGKGHIDSTTHTIKAIDPLVCSPGYVYSVSGSGQMYVVNGGTVSAVGQAASGVSSFNGVGIGANGTVAYGYERTNSSRTATIYKYDPIAGTWTSAFGPYDTTTTKNGSFGGSLIAGAVNLKTGNYLFGGFSGNTFSLWQYNPTTSVVTYVGWLDTTSGSGGNGDMAFNANGDLFVVEGGTSNGSGQVTVFSVTAADLAAAISSPGGQIVSSGSKSFGTGSMTNVNGLAFDASGKAYLGNGSYLYSYTMPDWSGSTQVTPNLSNSTDLASCSSPATITLQKDVLGRVQGTDQFTLTLSQGSTVLSSQTTTGSATGVQAVKAGPLPTAQGITIGFSETGSGGTNLSNYTSTYQCTVDGNDFFNSAQTGTSGQITIPAGANNVVCTFTNSPATLTLVKKVVDSNGLDITANTDVSQWQLKAAGSSGGFSGAASSPAVVNQPVGIGVKYTLSESPANVPGYTNGTAWSCKLTSGNGSVTSTSNTVTPAAGQGITCTITNTATPGVLSVHKTVKSVGGQAATSSTVVNPGDVVVYEITVTNSGGTAKSTLLTDTVQANMTYTGSSGEGWSCDLSPAVAGAKCTQSVSVPANSSVTKQFTMQAAASFPAGTTHVGNLVAPDNHAACDATGCHPVNPTAGVLHVVKSLTKVNGVDVAAGAVVKAGDKLTYTITVTNSGGTDASTTLHETVPANTTYSGSGEGWTVSGADYSQDVTGLVSGPTSVSFTVTVDSDLAGAKSIDNTVTTSHEGECTVVDDQSSCETHNPTPATIVVTKTWAGTPTQGDQVQLSITEPDAEGSLATGQSTVGGAEGDKNAEADIVVGSLVSVDEVYTKASVAYSKSLECSYVNGEQGKQTVTLDGQSFVVMPDMAGRTVTCTFTNTYNPPVPQPGPATLNIVKAASPGTTPIKPGDAFTYSLTVSNTSSETASSVHVSDPIPADIAITGTTASGWTCTVTGKDANGFGGTLACDLSGSLAGGATAPVITLAATLSSTVTAVSVSNTGSVSWINPDGSNGGPASSTAVIGVIEVAGESSTVTPTSPTTSSTSSIEVLPTSATSPGKIAYTGVNTFGLGMLALLLLAGGALVLGVGTMWRRKPRKH